ncbi:shikimate dehydrogenase [Candidatus Margulisiibacteriota bacterium]
MTKKAYIIGYPIGHSLSPTMHNAAAKALGIDLEYIPKKVKPKDLAKALKELRGPDVIGFNITVPHKEAIVPLLDDLSKPAQIIGAVNTVVNENGKLIGHNTDGAGFIESLKEDAKTAPKDKNVVILGAGGASRAVSVMLAEAEVAFLTITDIQEEKAKGLIEYVSSYFQTNCNLVKPNSPELQETINKADILVNCTPIGMHPKGKDSPLSPDIKLHANLLVYDLVYNPRETQLLKSAQTAGGRTCSGLGMLVRQGALAFTLWTHQEAPVATMRQAAEKSL